jgi:hypothetical protein
MEGSIFRKEMNLQQSLSSLKEELAKADQTLRNNIPPCCFLFVVSLVDSL